MTSDIALSKGALKGILSKSEKHKYEGKPLIVQVTNVKVIENPDSATGGATRRYRVLLNDGLYTLHGLIAPECVPYLESKSLRKLSIIQINEYTLATTQKRIILISGVELLSNNSEKPTVPLISCDNYFAEHPEDDDLQLNSTSSKSLVSRTVSPAPNSNSNMKRSQNNINERPVNPIELLSPYQNNWTIKARVSYKGDIKTWSNARGEGKLFNVNFLDESDEIRATAFNEVADTCYKLLEEGKVYYVSKARIQQSKPQFSHLSHPYELSLDKDTEITECFNTSDVPKLHFNFVKLSQIQDLEPNAIVDVIGVLKEVNPVFQITAKSTGKAFDRRNITIVDESGFAIVVGLWNTTAVDFNVEEGSVIAFKGCKVQDFGGRSLTLTQAGSLLANPDVSEAYSLKGWYDNQGVKENFKTLKTESSSSNQFSNRKLIGQAQDENLGVSEKPEYFSIKATINFLKTENFCYPACNNTIQGSSSQPAQQNTTCNRKIIELGDGSWRCEKCDLTFSEPFYRYILNCSVMDESGQIWITLFDQDARKLFGMSAGELLVLKEKQNNQESNEFQELTNEITMKEFNFRIKARQDTYNGAVRVRYQSVGLSDVDFNAEAEHICSELDSLLF
ncbi:uncharacterized protein PRCAT00003257001 [Priceomyces carsonii]|uniref:uncharacterized protein n=1 Tax=Priceomyces carsonii TaxID=28549 RepID=UPI002EDA85B5|nr:unnamed protein product [Priceomyces carsonii]